MNNILIETNRLLLRRITNNDIDDFMNIMGNDKTMYYLGKTLSNQEISDYINHISNTKFDNIYGEYAIVIKKSNQVIGHFAMNLKERDRSVELSYMLNSDYFGKSYGFECCQNVMNLLFEKHQINRVWADCDANNSSSIKMLTKIGMTLEGVLKQARYSKRFHTFYDVAVYAILKEEFDNRKMIDEKSCGAIVIEDNKVLLIKQKNNYAFGFPKGHGEPGETEQETAIREVKEETGVDIKIISNQRFSMSYVHSGNVKKEIVFFLAIPVSKNNQQIQEEEIVDLQWVDIDDVESLLVYENITKLWLEIKQVIINKEY